MITCDPSTSVIVAFARSAIERTRSAPAALSPVATTAQDGTITEVEGSHVIMISQPDAVAQVILEAVSSAREPVGTAGG